MIGQLNTCCCVDNCLEPTLGFFFFENLVCISVATLECALLIFFLVELQETCPARHRAFNVSKLSLNFDNFFILVFFCRSSTNLKKIWDFGKILLSLTELQGGPREKLGSGF